MGVVPLRKSEEKKDAQFQVAMQEFVANEMVFAVVGPVGAGNSEIAEALDELLRAKGYDSQILKARTVIEEAAGRAGYFIPSEQGISQSTALQNAGDKIREGSNDNAAVAVGLIAAIREQRAAKRAVPVEPGRAVEPDGERRAYILDSLRHPHEATLLRRLYQEAFCLIGVFCQEGERRQRLQNHKYPDAGREEIDRFMQRDENAPETHGQKVADTFHLADFFVDNSVPRFCKKAGKDEPNPEWDVSEQLGRLVDILTHTRIVRPRPSETGMFHAHGARMRSSCLSRQVGAALLDRSGNLVATGTNEVPRAGGGVYGGELLAAPSGDPGKDGDFRCFVHHGYCSNTRQQNAIIRDMFANVPEFAGIEVTDELMKKVRKTRIGQLIEFSRAVHAEMDALMSAARSGAKTGGTRLYVTTFPCHNCARHIVSAGVVEVQYIEPYLKSQAVPLHGDAIVIDPKEWNPVDEAGNQPQAGGNPNVLFRPFIGVAPRLYRRAFLKDRDLKDNFTGDMLTVYGPAEGQASNETLRMSYADVEAKFADFKIECKVEAGT